MKKFETLYLHVGLEKTGTTSIQQSMHAHRAKLEKLGYFYPECFAVGRNTLLATMVHPKAMVKPAFKMIIDKRGGTKESHIEHMMGLLKGEIAGTSANNLVLSSEFLAAHTDIGELKALYEPLAENVKVILYLREQGSLILSLHSTRVKGGGTEFGTLKHLEAGSLPRFLDFQYVVSSLEKHFEKEDIIIRNFDRAALVNGNAIDDFLTVIGLGKHISEFQVERSNESLSQKGIELLQEINPYLPDIVDGDKNRARMHMLSDMATLDGTEDFGKRTLDPDLAHKVNELTAKTNEWVRAKYFPDQETLFSSQARTGRADSSTKGTLDYSARLIANAYTRIARLERENKKLAWEKKNALSAAKNQKNKKTKTIKTGLAPVVAETPSLSAKSEAIDNPKAVLSTPTSFMAETDAGLQRIILHIGRHKSGTSALQHYFKANREFLYAKGVLYPYAGSSERQVAHHPIASACNQNTKDEAALSEIVGKLKAELKPHHHTLLLSSEAFQNITAKKWIKEFLAQFPGVQVDVICYVREFADYMVSAFRQAVQNQIRFQTFPEFCEHRYNTKRFLKLWKSVGHLHLKWFHPDLLKNGDVIEDFFAVTGIPKPKTHPSKPKNRSIGGNLLWMKMASNKLCSPFISYADMARLAQQHEGFREHFYIPQYRVDHLRKTSRYNKYYENIIGPVPYKSWEHCRMLPDDIRLGEDIKLLKDQHPNLDLTPLLELSQQSRTWFWTQS